MKRRFPDEQIIGMIKEYEAGVKAQELCREYGISDATFYIYGCLFRCKVSLLVNLRRSLVANIYPASPVDGAPKWGFRVVSLNKWSASEGHYKSRVPHTPEFAGRFIFLVVLQSLSRAQVWAWNSSFLSNIAQMMRAFLLATATMALFMPRRSRIELTHLLKASVLPCDTRTTERALWISRVEGVYRHAC